MPGFWGGLIGGLTRRLTCPYCRTVQASTRRPPPYEVVCASCRRPFRVTRAGAVPLDRPRGGGPPG